VIKCKNALGREERRHANLSSNTVTLHHAWIPHKSVSERRIEGTLYARRKSGREF
jgi:hypothetical protein